MRPPATIDDSFSLDEMFQWVQSAPDQNSYKCRMAIWLTRTGRLHAAKVADILGVSTQAVWLWIRQYNQEGPDGLERKGRGGRRWGFMRPEQERELLAPLLQQARSGARVSPPAVRLMVEEKLGRKVSMSYVYKLLQRNGLGTLQVSSQSGRSSGDHTDTFGKLSQPWQRST